MALRVLLADESSTIKKVIQLALQDYAVDVRAINVGLDVVPFAKNFKPDIVFADVLLQKRSGYDVCAEIKGDPQLKQTPVVLMWSGFLELDEDRFQVCQANAQLEKPFDVATLRKIVAQWVPKTKTQDIARYLTFPDVNTNTTAAPEEPVVELGGDVEGFSASAIHLADRQMQDSTWNMEQFAPIDQFGDPGFQELSLAKPPPQPTTAPTEQNVLADTPEDEGDARWVQKKINRFQVDLSEEQIEGQSEDLPIEFDLSEDLGDFEVEMPEPPPPPPLEYTTSAGIPLGKLDASMKSKIRVSESRIEEEIELEDFEVESPDTNSAKAAPLRGAAINGGNVPQLNSEELEALIRSQSQAVIESVVWKIVPEMAEQIIQRELQRLLKKSETPST